MGGKHVPVDAVATIFGYSNVRDERGVFGKSSDVGQVVIIVYIGGNSVGESRPICLGRYDRPRIPRGRNHGLVLTDHPLGVRSELDGFWPVVCGRQVRKFGGCGDAPASLYRDQEELTRGGDGVHHFGGVRSDKERTRRIGQHKYSDQGSVNRSGPHYGL